MRGEPGSPLLSKSAGPRLSGKRKRQLRWLKPLWPSPPQSNPLAPTPIKAPRLSTSGPLCLAVTTSARAYGAKQQTPQVRPWQPVAPEWCRGRVPVNFPDRRRDQGKLAGSRLLRTDLSSMTTLAIQQQLRTLDSDISVYLSQCPTIGCIR